MKREECARIRNGAKVAVVGGAGFLGSHLVNHLIEDRGCDVVVIDNLCVGKREFVHKQAHFVHHDITGSEEFLKKLFVSHKVEYVFNYAAWPYIPDSFERPLQVFNVNANGAIKVINAAHEAGCAAILQVSSAELYGNGQPIETTNDGNEQFRTYEPGGRCIETTPVVPHSTYGAAKAAVDYYCQSAWRERGTPVIALRQFNCVGERETHPYIVPEIISQLAKEPSDACIRLGNNSTRDFQYAGDAVVMATELLEKGEFGQVYNMGSEKAIRIYDLAELLAIAWGKKSLEIGQDPNRVRPWEIWHLQSDNTKLYNVIDSRPMVSLDDALRKTIADFREHNKWSWET